MVHNDFMKHYSNIEYLCGLEIVTTRNEIVIQQNQYNPTT